MEYLLQAELAWECTARIHLALALLHEIHYPRQDTHQPLASESLSVEQGWVTAYDWNFEELNEEAKQLVGKFV